MKQRNSFSVLCFVLISFGVSSVSAQTCMNRGKFSPNSTYGANLRKILSSLPSNVMAQDGFFYSGSIGQEPNRVYAIGMCIPGSTSDDCSDCVKTASDGLIKSCPSQTEAYSWPADPTLCLVRYSSASFLGSADLDPRFWVFNTEDINSNLTEFTEKWEDLVLRMIATASKSKSTPPSSNNHYEADIEPLKTSQNIYALMQCTPDLSSRDCENCLRQCASDYHSCCSQKQGGVVMRPSCFFQWDLYKFSKAFDNITVTKKEDSKGISAGIVVAIIIPVVVVVFILLFLAFVLYRRRKSYQRAEPEFDSDISTEHSLQYDFKTIEAATNKFSRSNKLGEGGFGKVYKGTFSNGTEVAVKRLSKTSGQGDAEFKNEVLVVAKLQHRNLVRLLGFCLHREERILVYEFVPNKSLNYFLFDPAKQGELDWTRRYKIIGGIARGILYLHQDSRLTIIHRDLKASNILLDTDMNPKIADFGMARIFGMDQTAEKTSRIVGTYGYMSPEYAMQGQYSIKSDVYSFGVSVLEIISGKKNSSFYQIDGAHDLLSYAWRLWRNGTPMDLVDPVIVHSCKMSEVVRCIHIGLLSVQEDPIDRPTLSTIIQMLTSNTMTLPVPREPTKDPLDSAQSIKSKFVPWSVNHASITDLYPR